MVVHRDGIFPISRNMRYLERHGVMDEDDVRSKTVARKVKLASERSDEQRDCGWFENSYRVFMILSRFVFNRRFALCSATT